MNIKIIIVVHSRTYVYKIKKKQVKIKNKMKITKRTTYTTNKQSFCIVIGF